MIQNPPSSIQKRFAIITVFTFGIGVITAGLALLAYAYLGTFVRYYADDYCLSGMLFQMGFWKAQVNLYMTWSPGFVHMFLISVSELFGHSSIRVWPALTIVAFAIALVWMLYEINRALLWNLSKWVVVLLAEWVVLFTLIGAPNQFQILFWRIGLVGYTVPMVFFPLLVGTLLFCARRAAPNGTPFIGVLVCALVAFVGGGISETYVTLQTSMIGIALLFAVVLIAKQEKRKWVMLLAELWQVPFSQC